MKLIKEKEKKINLLNDAMFKALFRSHEARKMFARFLGAVTGMRPEVFLQAQFIGGEISKRRMDEKGKTADIIILIDEDDQVIVEANQFWTKNLFLKNTSYAFANFLERTKVASKTYPKVFLINIDNFNYYKTDRPILNFMLRDEYGHIENDSYHSIHIILENVDKKKYNLDNEIVQFSEFLKAQNIDELEEKTKGDEDYMAAFREVKDLSCDPEYIGYYSLEESHRQELEDALDTGVELGIEQGI